jgi:hypothetical protein
MRTAPPANRRMQKWGFLRQHTTWCAALLPITPRAVPCCAAPPILHSRSWAAGIYYLSSIARCPSAAGVDRAGGGVGAGNDQSLVAGSAALCRLVVSAGAAPEYVPELKVYSGNPDDGGGGGGGAPEMKMRLPDSRLSRLQKAESQHGFQLTDKQARPPPPRRPAAMPDRRPAASHWHRHWHWHRHCRVR